MMVFACPIVPLWPCTRPRGCAVEYSQRARRNSCFILGEGFDFLSFFEAFETVERISHIFLRLQAQLCAFRSKHSVAERRFALQDLSGRLLHI